MITYQDIKCQDSTFECSLSALFGKKIKDVRGYISSEYGGFTFALFSIEFEDGTSVGVEGEHDFPYLVEWRTDKQPNFDEETLERLYNESNK